MIESKAELKFYIWADRIMNGYTTEPSFRSLICDVLMGGGIKEYLKAMRCYSYYKRQKGVLSKLMRHFYGFRFRKLGQKLSYSIGEDVFGYGLLIPHYGTIVVGGSNRIGNFAVLHTSTCISDKESVIGNGLYLSTGAKITKGITLGDGVMISANSVVNRSFGGNVLIVGTPAREKSQRPIWYLDEHLYDERVNRIENRWKLLESNIKSI